MGGIPRGADPVRIDVNPRDAAADRRGKMQRAATRAAADFEDVAGLCDLQQLSNSR